MSPKKTTPSPHDKTPFPILTRGRVPRNKEEVKEAIFATKVAQGTIPTEAWKTAFAEEVEEEELTGRDIYKRAYALKKRKKIKNMISWYEDEIRTFCNVHPAQWVRQMNQDVESARKAKHWPAVMRGMELLGKQAGFFSETMILKRGEEPLTEEQYIEQIRAIVAANPKLRQVIIDAGQEDIIDGDYKVLPTPEATSDDAGTESTAPPLEAGEGSSQEESLARSSDHPA